MEISQSLDAGVLLRGKNFLMRNEDVKADANLMLNLPQDGVNHLVVETLVKPAEGTTRVCKDSLQATGLEVFGEAVCASCNSFGSTLLVLIRSELK